MDAGPRLLQIPLRMLDCLGWFPFDMVTLAIRVALFDRVSTAPWPLRIGANVWFECNLWIGDETLCLAGDLGQLEGMALRVIDCPSLVEEVMPYRSTAIGGAGRPIDQVITLAATQQDISIMDVPNGGDVIHPRPVFTVVRERKGRRLGLEAAARGAGWGTDLEPNAMTPRDDKVVSLGLGHHEAPPKAGRVDAVVTFASARIGLLNTGATPLFDSILASRDLVDTLAISPEAMATIAVTLQALAKAGFRALDFFTGVLPSPGGAWPCAPR
jgi:NitT/TauT family transport system substrate-binding protein